jgi:hypothetical protein
VAKQTTFNLMALPAMVGLERVLGKPGAGHDLPVAIGCWQAIQQAHEHQFGTIARACV